MHRRNWLRLRQTRLVRCCCHQSHWVLVLACLARNRCLWRHCPQIHPRALLVHLHRNFVNWRRLRRTADSRSRKAAQSMIHQRGSSQAPCCLAAVATEAESSQRIADLEEQLVCRLKLRRKNPSPQAQVQLLHLQTTALCLSLRMLEAAQEPLLRFQRGLEGVLLLQNPLRSYRSLVELVPSKFRTKEEEPRSKLAQHRCFQIETKKTEPLLYRSSKKTKKRREH